MADKYDKNPGNVSGRYYVDSTCVHCGWCIGEAPECFLENESGVIVYKQPETADEEYWCEEAMMSCPTDSIGNDGEDDRD